MRECFQMKMASFDSAQVDWALLRQKPLEAIIPGVGRKTSHWLAQDLLPTKDHMTVG